jgi:hypothetical protein
MRALLAVSLVLLAAPATAAADIDLQKGIAGVNLGMTPDQAREVAGAPSKFATRNHPIIGRVREWRWGLTTATFDGTSADAKVISVSTTSKLQRTSADVGVGSKRATVRTKVPDVRCLVEFSYDHCFVGRYAVGRIVTDFAIGSTGRVVRVVVGRVID